MTALAKKTEQVKVRLARTKTAEGWKELRLSEVKKDMIFEVSTLDGEYEEPAKQYRATRDSEVSEKGEVMVHAVQVFDFGPFKV